MKPLTLENAQELLLGDTNALAAEHIEVKDSHGRYTNAEIVAARPQPAADLSAMDGYAMRVDDLAGPWRVTGESAAGRPFPGQLARGEAIRISTGALLPANAGAVLLQENALREGNSLSLTCDGEPSPRHVRRAGFDFRTGDILLPPGTRMGAAQIALALSAGLVELAVHRLPSVAIIDSGDELAPIGATCPSHQIPPSNGAMLAAMAAPLSSTVDRVGPVPDDVDALLAAFEQASGADLIVTSGGASVGDHDLMRPALDKWGATIDFWRVAIKPGKPLLVARRGEQVVLGLPGNPVSSYVTAFLFMLPLLRKLGGANVCRILPVAIQARLEQPLPPSGDRREFIRARYANGSVTPLGQQDSSALLSLAECNALIDRNTGCPATPAGQSVRAYLLEDGGIA